MSKKNLRKKIINLRRVNYVSHSVNFSDFQKILKKKKLKNIINVGGYYPINSEIECFEILHKLDKNKFKISLPVIKKNNNMDYYEWSFKDPLKISQKGIPEPEMNKKIYPDVLIVPLVAFDKNKFRLGYGGCYYDRYIAKILKFKKVLTIGLAFSFQKLKKIPINKFDQKLDYVITDKEIIK